MKHKVIIILSIFLFGCSGAFTTTIDKIDDVDFNKSIKTSELLSAIQKARKSTLFTFFKYHSDTLSNGIIKIEMKSFRSTIKNEVKLSFVKYVEEIIFIRSYSGDLISLYVHSIDYDDLDMSDDLTLYVIDSKKLSIFKHSRPEYFGHFQIPIKSQKYFKEICFSENCHFC